MKRGIDDENDEGDIGPLPVSELPSSRSNASNENDDLQGGKKKRKKNGQEFQRLFLDNLPSAQMYERSFMHRDVVSHVITTR